MTTAALGHHRAGTVATTSAASHSLQWSGATLVFLGLALVAWSHVLVNGPSASLASGSVDPVQAAWFLSWALHALETGQNPLFTHAIFAPSGVNVLESNSLLTLGVLLSPVTLAFGPLMTFNVVVISAPVLSALAASYLASRYASWFPACFAAGLVYGFGPYLTTDLRFGHPNLTFLALPPLILAAVDELFVRRRRSAAGTGAFLAVLFVLEFFISAEVALLTAMVAFVGLAILGVTHPHEATVSLRHAASGAALAVAVAGGALAYPLWYYVAGPRHITGPVWHTLPDAAASLESLVVPHSETGAVGFVSGGDGAYLGAVLLVLVIAAPFIWRRDRRIPFAAGMTLVAVICSLGYSLRLGRSSTGIPLPVGLFRHVPLLYSIAPYRFGAFTDLFAGITLALVLDVLRHGSLGRRLSSVLTGAVAVASLLPLALVLHWPYPARSATRPQVFAEAIFTRAARQTVVEYPPVDYTQADDMLWQALDGLHYDLTDGYAIQPGPSGSTEPFPRSGALALEFAAAELGRLRGTPPPSTVTALRQELVAQRVTVVVVDESSRGAPAITNVLDITLGRPARIDDGWDLWRTGARSRSG